MAVTNRSKKDLCIHSHVWMESLLQAQLDSISTGTWTVHVANSPSAADSLGEVPEALTNGNRLWRVVRNSQ